MRSSIRRRLIVAFLAVALTVASVLSVYFLTELEGYGLRKIEERLTSEQAVLASALSAQITTSGGRGLSDTQASILSSELNRNSQEQASRIRVLDRSGVSLADSTGADLDIGYSETPEVARALAGDTSSVQRALPDGRIMISVAGPVIVDGRVLGVVHTSAATFSIRTLVRDYRLQLAIAAVLFILGTLVLTEFLARWLSTPLQSLAEGAVAFASGDHSVRVRPTGSDETRAVAEAFNAMADEVQEALRELREEERRKSRFVSDVSHELRTPLTAIRGAAETLLDGDVPEDDARQFLSTIARESERLGRLANDLITLQRIEGATGELPLSRVDLASIARHAIDGLAPLTEARGVTVDIAGTAAPVLGDRDRLQQVFANLIDNASRVTPEGKKVTIELSDEDDRVIARVVDQGPGIAEKDAQRIFDRFYRAQSSRDRGTGGAGLGLAIVAAIVTGHGGTISAATLPEGGTAFTLSFPAVNPD
ncbi:MAG: ATP-binding protein [Coriobacteriia bacterium]|nr:ATP-binding protein [Coriobacteriia bacterium]